MDTVIIYNVLENQGRIVHFRCSPHKSQRPATLFRLVLHLVISHLNSHVYAAQLNLGRHFAAEAEATTRAPGRPGGR